MFSQSLQNDYISLWAISCQHPHQSKILKKTTEEIISLFTDVLVLE